AGATGCRKCTPEIPCVAASGRTTLGTPDAQNRKVALELKEIAPSHSVWIRRRKKVGAHVAHHENANHYSDDSCCGERHHFACRGAGGKPPSGSQGRPEQSEASTSARAAPRTTASAAVCARPATTRWLLKPACRGSGSTLVAVPVRRP